MSDRAFVDAVERERREKDRAFKTDPHSPIPSKARAAFRGLAYFPPDPAWRFRAKLVTHPKPEIVAMQTSTGDTREYLDLGHFALRAPDGTPFEVHAYWNENSPSLFLPYRDATSGKETYGAGRYLDLEWEGPLAEYEVDFNRAYNPYCAYSEDYSCPFPPFANWLTIAIRAGEKTPPSGPSG